MPVSAFAPALPILGQPVKVLGYTVLVSAACQCGTWAPLQCPIIVGEGRYELVNTACPHCRNVYTFKPQSVDANGIVTFAATIAKPVAVES